MAIQTSTQKNTLASSYIGAALYAAVYTTAPGGSAGTEPSGGSPAYARKLISWGSPTAGVVSGTCTFDIPTGTSLVGAGVHTAVTAGTYLDGVAVTSQAFASQGTYALTLTFTES